MRSLLSQQLKRSANPIRRAIFAHPFLQELHAGTLPMDRFTYFVLQDYRYLLDFAQVLCLGGAKSPDLKTLEIFTRHALIAVEVERTFHASFGKSLGLSQSDLDQTPKGPVTEAYTRHLQAVARGGSLAEIVAAVLPCYWIYGEVGKKLYKNRPRKPKIYREWIETYASEEYWRPVREQIRLMNELGRRANGEEKRRMRSHFLLSSRYEFLFWDQAYRLEEWPV
ncbi:MAG: thiaminase II [Deltaproteobacteria bacterium RIFCSPHIGHO2_02_FULL_60_17]|nr:MAG: thiaminase II [Deltaproteobacteria bacterium RIFCSPHIGHO2_02_FULL_60_17]